MDLPQGEENVRIVEKIVKEKNLDAEVIRHPNKAITSIESHLELYKDGPEHVLKCLCFVAKGKPLLVMASGEIKINVKKLEKISSMKEIRMANLSELENLFKRKPGEADALTISKDIPMFADKKLFEKDYVVGSAGSPYAGLKIKPKEILKVQNPIIEDLAKVE